MSLNNREIEGCDLVEKILIGSKPRHMLRLILQALLDGSGCLRHAHKPFFVSMYLWMVSLLFYFNGQKAVITRAKATRRLTAWVETTAACGGLKPYHVNLFACFFVIVPRM